METIDFHERITERRGGSSFRYYVRDPFISFSGSRFLYAAAASNGSADRQPHQRGRVSLDQGAHNITGLVEYRVSFRPILTITS